MLFTAGFLGQELFRIEEYSPLAEPVSALEAGPNGWLQQVNFVVFGVLTIAFALGMHRGVRPVRRGFAGPALLGVSGVGLLMAAGFPLREDAAGVTYDPGGHFVAGVTFFLSSAVGLVLLSRRLSPDPRWRGLAGLHAGVRSGGRGRFVVLGGLTVPDGAPLHDWAGLAQRSSCWGCCSPAGSRWPCACCVSPAAEPASGDELLLDLGDARVGQRRAVREHQRWGRSGCRR